MSQIKLVDNWSDWFFNPIKYILYLTCILYALLIYNNKLIIL
ncbi:hypothetical protein ABIC56_001145 [Acinetobacter bereziniae]|nr:hypothetical protein [Acinetobacter bereziniae]